MSGGGGKTICRRRRGWCNNSSRGLRGMAELAGEVADGAGLRVGKRTAEGVYLHRLALGLAPERIAGMVERAVELARVAADDFDVAKVALQEAKVSLLRYPAFFDHAFPTLACSWTVDLASGAITRREYGDAENPPVLHRKELLLPDDHPRLPEFRELTRQAEEAGLFSDVRYIGFMKQWQALLRFRGLAVEGHRLVQAADESGDGDPQVFRHKTALQRYTLSTPMQALWRHGYLEGQHSVFDYGCGRGGDVAVLRQRGIAVSGWDPHFAPEDPRVEADVVNLGFVLNVIEDLHERREALLGAFNLARSLLVVSVLLGGRTAFERYRLYRDGVLTQRGTFQKYFTQDELRQYLEAHLGREPVAVAPGIFFVFRDADQEQGFLAERQRQRPTLALVPSLPRPERPARVPRQPRAAKISKWDAHPDLLESYWQRCLDLGRAPEIVEFDAWGELRGSLGAPATVLRHLLATRGEEPLAAARRARLGDLLVYLALNLFEQRKSFSTLPETLQRDIRAFWGSYANARNEAAQLLFSAGRPEVIAAACSEAAGRGLGYLDGDHDLQIHSSLVIRLPPVLRVYVGCAARLYGEVESADMVKLHIGSGKVSVMTYDDFDGKAVPELIERVKINLRRQDIQFFEYGADPPPQPLYLKARYLAPEIEGYDAQSEFDAALQALGLFDFRGFGPERQAFYATLAANHLAIQGWELVRQSARPVRSRRTERPGDTPKRTRRGSQPRE